MLHEVIKAIHSLPSALKMASLSASSLDWFCCIKGLEKFHLWLINWFSFNWWYLAYNGKYLQAGLRGESSRRAKKLNKHLTIFHCIARTQSEKSRAYKIISLWSITRLLLTSNRKVCFSFHTAGQKSSVSFVIETLNWEMKATNM